ncbi:MAG: hypothetical protein ABI073_12410 [Luteolibacter sp.]
MNPVVNVRLVRSSRVVACFRVLLWLLPMGFAAITAFGLRSYSRYLPFPPSISICLWCVLNVGFIFGAGWERHGVQRRVIYFFLTQPFMILFFGALTGF